MEREKLAKITWDAETDSYLLSLNGHVQPVARLHTQELEDLKSEIERIYEEMSA